LADIWTHLGKNVGGGEKEREATESFNLKLRITGVYFFPVQRMKIYL